MSGHSGVTRKKTRKDDSPAEFKDSGVESRGNKSQRSCPNITNGRVHTGTSIASDHRMSLLRQSRAFCHKIVGVWNRQNRFAELDSTGLMAGSKERKPVVENLWLCAYIKVIYIHRTTKDETLGGKCHL